MTEIELLTLSASRRASDAERAWDLGPQRSTPPIPAAIAARLDRRSLRSPAVLVLDASLPLPSRDLLERLLDGPADAWHAGLRLGLGGQPRLYDHVKPLAMFSVPLDPTIEATSWHLSLRALLVRREVFDQLGGPSSCFETLTGAGLDLGLRWIRAGALVRHVPTLVPATAPPDPPVTDEDGIRVVARHHGRWWAGWALARAVVTRSVRPSAVRRLTHLVRTTPEAPLPHYRTPIGLDGSLGRTVSVVLPTIDRYAYLKPLLHQLSGQSHPPHQVLIVDQTPADRRRRDLTEIEPALAVTVFEQDEPGQCTARNRAIRAATGELLLFIDDDDEIGPDLIADHLRRLVDGIDASSGGVDDATAGPPPPGFRHRRASDNFPTNNTMLRRAALERSGLFDPVFDRGSRADHDLGMRLHLSGAMLIYDPDVLVFHHHAPAGGLRTHGARAVTRASSRRSLTQRNLPAVTQLYIGYRYGTARQRREDLAMATLTPISGDGPTSRQLVRALLQIAVLPSTYRRIRRTDATARALAASAAPVPTLGGSTRP